MSHQVIWTREVLDAFVREACLTDFQRELMETRIAGMSVTAQAYFFNRSVSSINREIARLKLLYDEAQLHSKILKPRKHSAQELYLDTH